MKLPARATERLRLWIGVGQDRGEIAKYQETIVRQEFDTLLRETVAVTRTWSGEDPPGLKKLPERVAELFRRSLLIIRSQLDCRGAVLASTDSDIMVTARAHYAYLWPRDGAFIASALDRVGLKELSRSFFEFCAEALSVSAARSSKGPGAALMHKYGPDGTLGASWHPWVVPGGRREVPIQADGTAAVVWAFCKHYAANKDKEFAQDMWERLVLPCSQFLTSEREEDTHLPLPSWDLWEERRGTHLYTTAMIVAALREAAWLGRELGDEANAALFEAASEETRAALEQYFWDEQKKTLVRMLSRDDEGNLVPTLPGRERVRRVRFWRAGPGQPARSGHDGGDWPQALGAHGDRGAGALRARLLLPRFRRLHQYSRQPVDHLHAVAGRVDNRHGEEGGRSASRARHDRVGDDLHPSCRHPARADLPRFLRAALGHSLNLVARPARHHHPQLPGQAADVLLSRLFSADLDLGFRDPAIRGIGDNQPVEHVGFGHLRDVGNGRFP